MGEFIQYEENKTYGVIRLNRPEKHHAISLEMARGLETTLENIHTSNIAFLVIESSGKGSFCAGGDLKEYHGDLTENEAYERLLLMMHVLQSIILFPVPVIALLYGNAFGGGCELATVCDFRIAKEGTRFGFVQSNIGILPGWGGGAALYKKIHATDAFHWITTGEAFSANQLKGKGWLHDIIPISEWNNREEILKSYTSKSRRQMLLLKQQYMNALQVDQLFMDMEKEVKACASVWGSEAHQKHVQRFMKR